MRPKIEELLEELDECQKKLISYPNPPEQDSTQTVDISSENG